MTGTNYHPTQMDPHLLNKEEYENPYQVIDQLFDLGNLPELKECLSTWMQLTVSGSFHRESRRDRSNLLYFYHKLEKVLDALAVIRRQRAA